MTVNNFLIAGGFSEPQDPLNLQRDEQDGSPGDSSDSINRFPIRLPKYIHQYTSAVPTIESATRSTCKAYAEFRPKNYTYRTEIELSAGRWTVKTTQDGEMIADEYPNARGLEIAILVINWWREFAVSKRSSLSQEIVDARASWINRALHKLLTDLQPADRRPALQLLLGEYGLGRIDTPQIASMAGARWATTAEWHLQKELPEAARVDAVRLLAEVAAG